MGRPTTEFETPVGKQKVVIYTWVTGGEMNEIRKIMFDKTTVNPSNPQDLQIPGSVYMDYQKEAIKKLVLSVDGKTENILQEVLDMRSKDYDFVVSKVIDLVNQSEVTEEAKK